ncbi:MAG: aldehyde dehydrogenase family protein [Acidimicrobiales bacterium]
MSTLTGSSNPTGLFIGGTWRSAEGDATMASVNPANGEEFAQVSVASASDVDAAVEAARKAMTSPSWTEIPKPTLGKLLWRVADLIDDNADELAQLETRDNGQPIGVSRNANVTATSEHFRYFAGWATKIEGATVPVGNPSVFHYTRREPVGVCALITPWNFPLMIAAWKLAPALACGNAVVLKPAEQTSLTAARLVELCDEAGFPAGVINLVTGGPEIGRALASHPGVDKVSFTGSTEVGREILRNSADNFTRVTLELGGKTPMLIAGDADMDAAVMGCVQGALFNSGQVCAAYARFYVDRKRAEEFTEKATAATQAMRLGPGLDPETQLGPLVSEEHLGSVAAHVQKALGEGAQLVTGGRRADGPGLERGFFYEPTVLTHVTDEMAIARDEVFGPVIPIFAYDDIDEAVARANASPYGLAASVWTRDLSLAHTLSARLRAGAIFVNGLHVPDPAAPWGGFKQSGIGREMGSYALDAYTEVKGVFINL